MKHFAFYISFVAFMSIAQSGDLKSDFGQNGKMSIDIDDLDNLVGLLEDGQGNTYFYGNTSEDLGGVYPTDIFFGKMDEFGTVDPAFGTNGISRYDFPGFSNSTITKATYHSSGIYFIGQGINPTSLDTVGIFVGKVNLDGQLDLNFGSNGFFTSQFLGTYNTAGSIIIDSQDKVVFCGSTTDDIGTFVEFPLICRLHLDGSADSTFGNTGLVCYDYYSGTVIDAMDIPTYEERHGDGAYISEIIEIGNNYFLAGKYVSTSYSQMHIMSFDKSGQLNTDFVSPGPQVFQLDPGTNHYLKDIIYTGEHVYLAITTQGNYDNDIVIQKIDTNGVILDYFTISHSNYLHTTKFIEFHNNKLFAGGYYLDPVNVSPGYDSDWAKIYCLGSDHTIITDFEFQQAMNSGDEVGAQDMVMHNEFGVTGGYMNNLSGSNITDLFFMAFEVEDELDVLAESNQINLYPNPGQNQIQASQDIGYFEIYDLLGNTVLTGIASQNINIENLSEGTYVLHAPSSNLKWKFIKQ